MFLRKLKLGEISPQVKAIFVGVVSSATGFILWDYHQKTGPDVSFLKFYLNLLAKLHVPIYVAAIIGIVVVQVVREVWSFLREPAEITTSISDTSNSDAITTGGNPQDASEGRGAGDPPGRLMRIAPPIYPSGRDSFPVGKIIITGTCSGNPPDGWRFAFFTRRDDSYWPKSRLQINRDGTWTCSIEENHEGETELVAAQVADGVYLWISIYGYVGNKYKEWVGQKLDPLPDSIRIDDVKTIKIGPRSG